MNTIRSVNENNVMVVTNYYDAMLRKKFDVMADYLCANVHFISPTVEMYGKEQVVKAAEKFSEILQDIQIRSKFASNGQVMFAYDMVLPDPVGTFRAAVLMDCVDGQIIKIELFYDARIFDKANG